ncbi:MAG: methyl-coenzyme M reductase operon protein D [Candidatus Methanospirareceae archaeon]
MHVEEDFQQVTEVVVIPERLLGDTTTKNILSELRDVKGIRGIIIQGPSYITRTMKIGDQVIKPSVKVGKFIIEIEEEGVVEEIRRICDSFLPFGYIISVSKYKRRKPTVSEYLGKKPVKELGVLRKKEGD